MVEVIRSAGTGVRIPKILDRLAKNGFPVETSSPYRTLYKLLSTDDRFVNADGKWKLKVEVMKK